MTQFKKRMLKWQIAFCCLELESLRDSLPIVWSVSPGGIFQKGVRWEKDPWGPTCFSWVCKASDWRSQTPKKRRAFDLSWMSTGELWGGWWVISNRITKAATDSALGTPASQPPVLPHTPAPHPGNLRPPLPSSRLDLWGVSSTWAMLPSSGERGYHRDESCMESNSPTVDCQGWVSYPLKGLKGSFEKMLWNWRELREFPQCQLPHGFVQIRKVFFHVGGWSPRVNSLVNEKQIIFQLPSPSSVRKSCTVGNLHNPVLLHQYLLQAPQLPAANIK